MRLIGWLDKLRKILNSMMLGVLMLVLMMWGLYQLNNSPSSITLDNGSRLQWVPCWFNIHTKTRCAYFFPKDGHAKIQIPVVMIKSHHPSKQHTPLLYLAGGPGYPTGLEVEDMEEWEEWYKEKHLPYDLVLFDQRGTGQGYPQLHCPQVVSLLRTVVDQPLSRRQIFTLLQPVIEQCYHTFVEKGISLSNYNTSASSQDVLDLMELLGHNIQWNLYGISYGTRLALDILRTHPQKIRSAILDSVYPPEKQDLLETPFLYQHALSTLFDGCKKDLACRKAFPNLEDKFFELLEQLHQTPHTMVVTDPDSGFPLKISVTDENLVETIFLSLYDTHLIPLIPKAIYSVLQGREEAMTPLLQEYVEVLFDAQLSEGTYFSVECHDNGKVTREQFSNRVAQYPKLKRLFEDFWDTWFCHLWKVGDAGERFRQPVTSTVPTLFLAGTYDPITPAVWTHTASSRFSNGYFFEFPVGHGVFDTNACAARLVQDFLQSPHHKPYRDCLKQIEGPKFVVNVSEQRSINGDI